MEYSTWNKWDLHIHTRASKVKCSNGDEYFGPGYAFSADECISFRNNIMAQGVKLVAITDHNYFDAEQFITIKELFKQNNGNALPGVEIRTFFYLNEKTNEVEYPVNGNTTNLKKSKNLHCVIIFNDDKNFTIEKYKCIQEKLESLYKNTDSVFIGNILDEFLINNFEFFIIPHFEKNPDLERAVPDRSGDKQIEKNVELKTKWIVGGFFSALDGNVSKIISKKIGAIEYLRKVYECGMPAIRTSDNHDYRNYTGDVSEFKALCTFNGLKLAFSDYDQRVRYQAKDIVKNDVIASINISSNNNSNIKNCRIELSPYLNCIIGGRSSGKSLLLALIGKQIGEKTNNHINSSLRH